MSWEKKKVRHEDGRNGIIESEFIGCGFRALTIRLENGDRDVIELSSEGKNKYTAGWSWFYKSGDPALNGGQEQWIPFGE